MIFAAISLYMPFPGVSVIGHELEKDWTAPPAPRASQAKLNVNVFA